METHFRNPIGCICLGAVLLLSIPSPVPAHPLDNWHWRNPLPQGNNLRGIAYGMGTFVAVGDRGTIVTSPDGAAWNQATSGTTSNLSAVAFGGGYFVAVGDAGTVLVSSNSIDWAPRETGIHATLRNVAFGPGLFVIVGDFGAILTSLDLTNWERVFTDTLASIWSVTWNGQDAIAVGAGGTILRSQGGSAWTLITWGGFLLSPSPSECVISGKNGLFIAFLDGTVFSSTDGFIWDYQPQNSLPVDVAATYANGRYVGFDQGTPMTSVDGLDWTEGTQHYPSVHGVVFGAGNFVAVGDAGRILTSPDGASWNQVNDPTSMNFSELAAGNDRVLATAGPSLLVVSNDLTVLKDDFLMGSSYWPGRIFFGNGIFLAGFLRSLNGTDWSYANTNMSHPPGVIGFANGSFWGVSNSTQILKSTDGVNWAVAGATPDWFSLQNFRLAFGNGTYAAVNLSGIVLTSPDGVLWRSIAFGSLNINDIVFAGGQFLALTGYSTNFTLSSSDGINWATNVNNLPMRGVNGLCWGAGYYMAVLDFDRLFTSVDGINWTARAIAVPAGLADCLYDNGTFWVCGYNALLQSDSVLGGPVVLNEPGSQAAPPGGSAQFGIKVSGDEPIAYQWIKDGSVLTGQTNSTLSLTNVQFQDAGLYWVSASNPTGSAISQKVTLTVQPGASLSISNFVGIAIHGSVGKNYSLEYSDALNPNSWQPLTNLTLTVNPYLWIDYQSPSAPRRFYRVTLIP